MSKIRAKNFTDFEKSDLLDKIFIYRHIIENKQTDHTLNSKKDEAWTKIAEEYNKNKIIKRTEKNLRNCWDNIKRDTRKYCAAYKRETYKTGGGTVKVEKNPIFERAQEIMGETAIHGLNNPFDSDSIDDKENVSSIIDISEDEDDDNDTTQVFTYLIKNNEITDWTSWDKEKLKSQLSSPLKGNIENIPTTSKNIKPRKRKFENYKTSDEAKIDLADTLKANIEEKKDYEIKILKAKLEKEKLNIDLLKITIEKEKLIKKTLEKKTDITFTL